MVLDAVLIVIVALAMILSARRGFTKTLLSAVGWIFCLVLGLLYCDDIADFIAAKTTFDEKLTRSLAQAMWSGSHGSAFLKAIPEFLRSAVGAAAKNVENDAAESLARILISLLAFVLIVAAVKIVCLLISLLFSKEHHKGFIGAADTAAGLAIGLLIGIFYCFLALCVLVLILNLLPEGAQAWVHTELDESVIAGGLYQNNALLLLVESIVTD